MTSSVPSIPCRRSLTFVVVVGLGAAGLAAAGCASSKMGPENRLVPGPSGAVAAAPLSQHRIAILAGSATSKGVFIVDLNDGQVHRSFGVTREATAIAAEGGNGPLLVTVGGVTNRGRPFGAVERWSLAGRKTRVLAMPAEALRITRVVQGTAYVLVGNRSARAAIPLRVPSLTVGRPVALDANTSTLQLCTIGASPYLVYSSGPRTRAAAFQGEGPIVVRELDTGMIMRSAVIAESPVCIQDRQQVFALQRSFATASVVVLSLPTLLQQGLIPASNDVVALYETEDHHLAALNATSRLSNVEVFSDDALALKPPPK